METSQPVQNPIQQQVESSQKKTLNKFGLIIGSLLVLLAVGFGGYYVGLKNGKNDVKPVSADKENGLKPIYDDGVNGNLAPANWLTLNKPELGLTLKYPPTYKIIAESKNTVELGTDTESFVNISSDLKNYDEGNLCASGTSHFPCIDKDLSAGAGQIVPIQDMAFGFYSGKSFYISSGSADSAYHVLQINGKQPIELRAYISGGGLDETFKQIVSSVEVK